MMNDGKFTKSDVYIQKNLVSIKTGYKCLKCGREDIVLVRRNGDKRTDNWVFAKMNAECGCDDGAQSIKI